MMKSGVKWVYQMVRRPGGQKMEAGQKPSLCFRGRTHMLCVSVGHPVRILKRPVRDFDLCRDLSHMFGYRLSLQQHKIIGVP